MGKQGLTIHHAGVVVACCVQCGIPVAMIISTPGIFYPVMAEDFGVQTAEISVWMSITMLASAAFSPLVGNLLQRFRLKPLRLLAIALAGALMLVFAWAPVPWVLWVAAVGFGYCLVLLTALGPITLINRWFHERVGALTGISMAFTAIGGVVFLMLGQTVIEAFGWRMAYGVFAVIAWAVGIPVEALACRERPEECGVLPYGMTPGALSPDEEGRSTDTADATHETGVAQAQAKRVMRSAPFSLLVCCGFLMNLVCQVNGFFPKYVLWVDGQVAAGLAGAFASGAVLSSICQTGSAVGKIGLGAFSDVSVRGACIALAACGGVGIACIWQLATTPLIMVGGFIFGFFIAGVLVLMPMLCRSVFGTGEMYPIVYSRIAVAPTLGGAVGNIVWPVLADGVAGFDAVFAGAILAVVLVVATALGALHLGKNVEHAGDA